MAAIAWWAIPIGATLIAVLWTSWLSRPRGPEDVHDTVKSYERFKAALSTEAPSSGAPSSGAPSTGGRRAGRQLHRSTSRGLVRGLRTRRST